MAIDCDVQDHELLAGSKQLQAMDLINQRTLHHPHDTAFKIGMSEPRVVRQMIEKYLPKHFAERIDMDTLVLSNASYIDADLKHKHSDVLYQCKSHEGDRCILYFLWEHQSTYDKNIVIRLFGYICRIMESHLQQFGDNVKLPVVIPILVYNGIQSPYPGSCDWADSFESPELARALMFRPFNLIDLTVISDAELMRHRWTSMMTMMLKHLRREDFMVIQQDIINCLAFIYHQGGSERLAVKWLKCVMTSANIENKDDFIASIEAMFPTMGGHMATVAQQLYDEGVQQGMLQGRLEGIQKGVASERKRFILKMLQHGKSITDIALLFDIPECEVESIRQEAADSDCSG